jgi:predicted transcriptional regulator
MAKTTSFRMDEDLGDKIEALARTLDRPKGWIIEQAVRRYVETEGWQIEAIQEAMDDVRSGRADLRSHDEATSRAAAKLEEHGLTES